jgi:hypothetical protein
MAPTAARERGQTAQRQAGTPFGVEDAYTTFRAVARNRDWTGVTEGFGFSGGVAPITGLPRNVKCPAGAETLEECSRSDGSLCRVHERVMRLNNLVNYPVTLRLTARDENGRVVPQFLPNGRPAVRTEQSYRVLTEQEYEREFGDGGDEQPDLSDF